MANKHIQTRTHKKNPNAKYWKKKKTGLKLLFFTTAATNRSLKTHIKLHFSGYLESDTHD